MQGPSASQLSWVQIGFLPRTPDGCGYCREGKQTHHVDVHVHAPGGGRDWAVSVESGTRRSERACQPVVAALGDNVTLSLAEPCVGDHDSNGDVTSDSVEGEGRGQLGDRFDGDVLPAG